VPPGEDPDEDLLDHLVLTDDDLGQLTPNPAVAFTESLHGFEITSWSDGLLLLAGRGWIVFRFRHILWPSRKQLYYKDIKRIIL
jgi:hypothetical protein